MKRLNILYAGCVLLKLVCAITIIGIVLLFLGLFGVGNIGEYIIDRPVSFVTNTAAFAFLVVIMFWVGIIMVYTTSIQLGLKHRIFGIVCGFIPFLNIYMFFKIIKICSNEYRFEKEKFILNEKRASEKICQTKYPILMVHGVFFRDFSHVNYWGRIPAELTKNGATIYYGQHNSASPVRYSALELEKRIKEIIKETGAEKLNIIAHSKGGLDSRAAVALTDAGQYVASITTINTPHRGCEFADYLLHKIGQKEKDAIAHAYNSAASKLGDHDPDFLAAVTDLTHTNCTSFNEEIKDVPGIYYQSFGSKLNRATSGRFPLNMTTSFVGLFDGPNDGLVGEKSFPWGSAYKFLTVEGKRGISHGDLIDLNRENIKGFDVREFYVELVKDLKAKGF